MKTKNKNKNYKYDFGSFVRTDGTNVGSLAGFAGQAIGGSAGNVLSGVGSGIAAGAAFGPLGAGIGGLIGLGGALLGNKKRKQQEEKLEKQQQLNTQTSYNNNLAQTFDINNENPYGNLIFAKGGVVPANFINIEKGELQIDPSTGKIIREYDRINPETGGLYEKHSKGVDTKNNFVSAEEGTFIITKDKAKDYKKAIDTNDKLYQNSILQNIKNVKDREGLSKKFALGSFVDPTKPPYLSAMNGSPWNPSMMVDQWKGLTPSPYVSANTGISSPGSVNGLQSRVSGIPSTSGSDGKSAFSGVAGNLLNYAPALLNIGQGLFGKVEQQAQLQPNLNPYRRQVLNNMPQDISLNPLVNRINRNQTAQFRQIDNTTSSNPIARANKNNVFANTQNQLSDVYLQQQQMNNQIRGQRSNIYAGLGAQDMQEQARTQQLNLGIDQNNQQNRAAKTNILNTGLAQLQQVQQNQTFNNQQKNNDALRQKMLLEMFPNLRFYQETFGGI